MHEAEDLIVPQSIDDQANAGSNDNGLWGDSFVHNSYVVYVYV